MFRIKICGITNLDDARHAAQAGADAIGLNFYLGSPRCCAFDVAQQIVEDLPAHVRRVGVFVNASPEEVRKIATVLRLDLVQLHGDEPPEALGALRGLAVVRALRVDHDFGPVHTYLERCHRLAAMPRMVLLDACVRGAYGGTGQTSDWAGLAAARSSLSGLPLVLAGGLTPANVTEAIAAVRPWGVDVAGGVEEAPGRKCFESMKAFVAAAQVAFERLATWH